MGPTSLTITKRTRAAKKNNQEPAMSFALAGRYTVHLVANCKCPHCKRNLRASDVEADFGDVRLICAGCHRDVLLIGAVS